jgi:hypothetical protein
MSTSTPPPEQGDDCEDTYGEDEHCDGYSDGYKGNWNIEYKDNVDDWYYVTGLGWVHEYTGANGKIVHDDNDGKFYAFPIYP